MRRRLEAVQLAIYKMWYSHRAQRSQIGLQNRPICTVQIDHVGAKLQTFNIRDMMMRNAILFHSGDDPFTPWPTRPWGERSPSKVESETTENKSS